MPTMSTIFNRLMRIEPIRRQSMVILILQIAITFIGFLSTMYFAHTIGASVLGAYFLFLAYVGTLNLFYDGGFGGAVVKRISEGKDQNEFYSAFVVSRMILVIFSIAVLILIYPLLTDLHDMYFWLLIALVSGFIFSSILYGIYGMGKAGIYQTMGFLNSILCIFFQVIAVFLGFGAAGLAGGFIFGMIAASIIGMRYLDMRLVRFRSYHLHSLVSYSFWIFLSSSGSLVFTYADTLMVGYFLETADVGIYRVVFQFTTIAAFTTTAMRTVLFPNISKWSVSGDTDRIAVSLSKAFTYSLMLAVPVLAGGLLLGDKLLYYFYGSDFESGNYTLYLLLVMQVVNVFVFLQTTYINGLNYPKKALKVTIVAATANIVLNFALIPALGIEGAALATLLTMTLNALLAYFVLSRFINVNIEYVPVRNVIISSSIMVVFLGFYRLLIPLSNIWITLLSVLLGGIVYTMFLLKIDTGVRTEIKNLLDY